LQLICFEKKSKKKNDEASARKKERERENQSEGTPRRAASSSREKENARATAKGTPSLTKPHFSKKREEGRKSVPETINGFNFGEHMACAYEVPSLFT